MYDKGRNVVCNSSYDDGTVHDPDGISSIASKMAVVCVDVVCPEDVERLHRERLHLILQRLYDSDAAIPDGWRDPTQPIHVRVPNPTLYRILPHAVTTLHSSAVDIFQLDAIRGLLSRNLVKESPAAGVLFTIEVSGLVVGAAVINDRRGLAMFRLARDEPTSRAGRLLMDALLVRCVGGPAVVAPSAIGFFLALGWRMAAERPAARLAEPGWLSAGPPISPFLLLQSLYIGRDATEPLFEATRFSDARPAWASEGAWRAAVYGGTLRHRRTLHLREPSSLVWDMPAFYVGAARSFFLRMDSNPHVWVAMKH